MRNTDKKSVSKKKHVPRKYTRKTKTIVRKGGLWPIFKEETCIKRTHH